jgi:hypothetical protein
MRKIEIVGMMIIMVFASAAITYSLTCNYFYNDLIVNIKNQNIGITDSYLIKSNSVGYEAINGNGSIDYISNDFSTVLNDAYNTIPTYGSITIICNATVTRPLIILKSITIDALRSYITLSSNWLCVGDASTFVSDGGTIRLGVVDGQNKNLGYKAVIMQDATAWIISWNKIKQCETGIYFNPVGIGCGENTFNGGWITNCDVGIGTNITGQNGCWCQGNVLRFSIYACSNYGLFWSGTSAYDMNTFIGNSDCGIGQDPEYPLAGGGVDVYETAGRNYLYIYGTQSTSIYAPNSFWFGIQGFKIPITITDIEAAKLNVGVSNVYGTPYILQHTYTMPRTIAFTFSGSFSGGETISIRIQSITSENPSKTYNLTKTATDTTTIVLTDDELFGTLLGNGASSGASILSWNFWVKSNQATTAVGIQLCFRS